MGNPTKIRDMREIEQWFEEGWSYDEMVAYYREHYGVEISRASLIRARKRLGLPARHIRDAKLMPWVVERKHSAYLPALRLRQLARLRAEEADSDFESGLSDEQRHDLAAWLDRLKRESLAVHYDPDTEEGWFYVPRREEEDVNWPVSAPRPGARLSSMPSTTE